MECHYAERLVSYAMLSVVTLITIILSCFAVFLTFSYTLNNKSATFASYTKINAWLHTANSRVDNSALVLTF